VLLASIDYTTVIVAAIGAIVAIVNGLGIALIYTHIRTPSGTTIGKQTESVHHVALGNNYRLQTLTNELSKRVPREAEDEELQANPPNGDKLKRVHPEDG
jgi:hypothetical protein